MKGKVSKRSVDALKPRTSGDVWLWDTELRGFGARVMPSGAKSFVVSYYAPGLHLVRRRVTLCTFGPKSADEARGDAKLLLARVESGDDPAKEKADGRRAAKEETVEKLFADYVSDQKGLRKHKSRTTEFFESLGKLYIIPTLGKLPITKITTRDVVALHRKIGDAGKAVTANRVSRLLRAFWGWAEKKEYVIGKNPASKIDEYPEEGRQRFLNLDEMGRLGAAIHKAETVGVPAAPGRKKKSSAKRDRNKGMFTSAALPANPVGIAALRFLAFSGWREQEVMTLQWDFVDSETGRATLPDTKTGKSVRSIAAPALEVLAAQSKVEGNPFVFPGRIDGQPLRDIQRLWYAVRHEAKLGDVRLHDLRHSFASAAIARGLPLIIVQSLLGHLDYRSTLIYAHSSDDARKSAADDVGKTIRDAMAADPKATGTPDDTGVVSIASRR